MSRGLGARQILILEALYSLEDEHGDRWFRIWKVLDAAWKLGIQQEEDALKARFRAEKEHTAKFAAAGDEDARRRHKIDVMMGAIGSSIRQGISRKGRARR